jgi:hypothetical protein
MEFFQSGANCKQSASIKKESKVMEKEIGK